MDDFFANCAAVTAAAGKEKFGGERAGAKRVVRKKIAMCAKFLCSVETRGFFSAYGPLHICLI